MHEQAKQRKQALQRRANADNNPLQKKQQEGLATFQDNRPSTIAQTKLWDSIHNNTADTQNQGSFQFKSHYSSMAQNLLQYKQNNNGQTTQRMAAEDDEDLLQGKFKGKAPVQRMVESEDEEDLLQGKFSQQPIQKMDEDDEDKKRKEEATNWYNKKTHPYHGSNKYRSKKKKNAEREGGIQDGIEHLLFLKSLPKKKKKPPKLSKKAKKKIGMRNKAKKRFG